MIQRYDHETEADPMVLWGNGPYVLFTDHETDKAAAVAEAIVAERERRVPSPTVKRLLLEYAAAIVRYEGLPHRQKNARGGDFVGDRGCEQLTREDVDIARKAILTHVARVPSLEAVESATAELRAETAAAWSSAFGVAGYKTDKMRVNAEHTFNGVATLGIVDRLVALGCWERLDDDGDHQCYRPVELQDSGGDDGK